MERSLEWWEVALRYMENTRDDGNFVHRVSEVVYAFDGGAGCFTDLSPRLNAMRLALIGVWHANLKTRGVG